MTALDDQPRTELSVSLLISLDYFCFITVAPEEMHPALVWLNEMIQTGRIKDSHFLLQQIDMFSSLFGNVSDDPIRGQRNLHRHYPAAILLQESIREARSGRQAHSIYLGKHNVGKGSSTYAEGSVQLPDPNCVNHAGLSDSSLYKKAAVPFHLME